MNIRLVGVKLLPGGIKVNNLVSWFRFEIINSGIDIGRDGSGDWSLAFGRRGSV